MAPLQHACVVCPPAWALVRMQTSLCPCARHRSLFRVMAGLWPLQAGEISLPERGRIFYLSQRPYLVSGSLRDQLMYPFPPAAVWDATQPAAQVGAGRGGGGEPPSGFGKRTFASLAGLVHLRPSSKAGLVHRCLTPWPHPPLPALALPSRRPSMSPRRAPCRQL